MTPAFFALLLCAGTLPATAHASETEDGPPLTLADIPEIRIEIIGTLGSMNSYVPPQTGDVGTFAAADFNEPQSGTLKFQRNVEGEEARASYIVIPGPLRIDKHVTRHGDRWLRLVGEEGRTRLRIEIHPVGVREDGRCRVWFLMETDGEISGVAHGHGQFIKNTEAEQQSR